MDSPHTNFAVNAFSASGASGLYDRARPDYPTNALTPIYDALKHGTQSGKVGRKVIELGSGTGIFTRCFVQSDVENLVESILAVEPSEGMRLGFTNTVLNSDSFDTRGKKIETVHGLFNEIPVKEDSCCDLLVIAQAWHWCINKDQQAALIEIARVLKKGGHFALIWNMEDRQTAQWVANIRDIYEEYEYGVPQYRTGEWKNMFKVPEFSQLFEEPVEHHIKRFIQTTRDGVKDRVASKSYITALTPEKRDEVMKAVDEVLDRKEGLIWIDEEKGIFEYPYVTDVYVMKRK